MRKTKARLEKVKKAKEEAKKKPKKLKAKKAKVRKAETPAKAGRKFIYYFGDRKAEGNGRMKDLLGGKGAGLSEMTNAGAPVPSGFTITTEACKLFYQNDMKLPKPIEKEIRSNLERVQKSMGAKFGDPSSPLLLSVRSGAKFSMPGMMDTVLNLGLNDQTAEGLVKKSQNERFVYDSYRRFVQMFGNVVLGIDKDQFEKILQKKKDAKHIKHDASLLVEDLKELVRKFKAKIKEKTREEFP
ncbi:MAG: pyruvate, phosphate dikinase, partial [candidate division Zixibacteria bacterium]|nr:pyruvate, phosphate dikinase [candidate division Zixibacteria bacterium]